MGSLLEPTPFEPITIARLGSLWVQPSQRSTGIGSLLVQALLEWAREVGAVQAQVTAYAANTGAIRFYARHGLTPHTLVMRGPLTR